MNRKDDSGWIGPEAFMPQHVPLGRLPLPAAHDIHLWYLHLGELGGSLKHALAGESSSQETEELSLQQLRFTRRFYLRLLLGAYLDIPGKDVVVNRSNRGKPVLDASVHDSPLKFSMAKSENRVLIGISSFHHLGVDLEPAGRKASNPLRLARRFFSPAEFAELEALGPERLDESFLRAWALNEAVVKASGLGIANQLNRFTLRMDPCLPPAMVDIEYDLAANWSLALVKPDSEFIAAVASRQTRLDISCFQLLPAQ
jgi:4'-phosphopantetheinyl transferase